MNPTDLWPILAGSAVVVFGAGGLAEKMRNGKYLSNNVYVEHCKLEDERWERVKKDLDKIWDKLNER